MLHHRSFVLAFAIFVALGISFFPADPVVLRAQQPGKDIYQDFRGSKPLEDEWKMIPPKHDAWTKSEDAGLRITLPKTRLSNQPVGIRLMFDLSGDFEITGAYELVSIEAPPAGGSGVGVAFNLIGRNDKKKFAKLGRFVRAGGEGVYLAECWMKDGPPKVAPTKAMAGQLRLIREGAKLRYLVADDPPNVFREIWSTEFTAEDLENVRFAATNNASPAGIDVRLVDLRIHFGAPAKAGEPVAAPAAEQDAKPAGQGWLAAALLIGFAAVLLLAGVVGLVVFLRLRGAHIAAKDDEATEAEAVPSNVSFPCPACGKSLKAKAASAGKKVKCSHCGKPAIVPEES